MQLRRAFAFFSVLLICFPVGCGSSSRHLTSAPGHYHREYSPRQTPPPCGSVEADAPLRNEAQALRAKPVEDIIKDAEAEIVQPVETMPEPSSPKVAETPMEERAIPLILPEMSMEDETVLEPAIPEPSGTLSHVVFRWNAEHGEAGTGAKDNVKLKKWGKARVGDDGAMHLDGGAYVVDGLDDALLHAAQKSNELTIELALTTSNLSQSGPARILSFSTDHNSRNFTVGQERDQLIFRLRTSMNDKNGTSPELKVVKLRNGKPTHIVLSYRDGKTVCYVNGRKRFESEDVQGDFSNWQPHHLLLGDEWKRQRDWSGIIHRVVISTSGVSPEVAAAAFSDWKRSTQ